MTFQQGPVPDDGTKVNTRLGEACGRRLQKSHGRSRINLKGRTGIIVRQCKRNADRSAAHRIEVCLSVLKFAPPALPPALAPNWPFSFPVRLRSRDVPCPESLFQKRAISFPIGTDRQRRRPRVFSERGALAGYTQVCWNESHCRFIW
jgi:hypothetical protein